MGSSKFLRAIGNHSRSTPNFHLHNALDIQPIPVLIHRLTDKFFAHCHLDPNPLVQQIGNYTLAELTDFLLVSMAVKYNNVLLNLITGCLYWLTTCFGQLHDHHRVYNT